MEEKTVNVDLLRSLLEQLSRPLDDHDDVSPATEAPATENGEAVSVKVGVSNLRRQPLVRFEQAD